MIHWVLFGSTQTGSSRIHGYRIHKHLKRRGFASGIVFGPPSPVVVFDLPWENTSELAQADYFRRDDVIVFETVRGGRARELAAKLKERGLKVVFSEADLYADSEIVNLADEVVCSSRFLAEAYAARHSRPVAYIPDAVESVLSCGELANRVRPVRKSLTVLWFGDAGHWATLDPVRSVLRRRGFADYRLVTVSNHPDADVPWCLATCHKLLRLCDVVVVPTACHPKALAKSNNRVTQAMALGASVLASPIPAYTDVIAPGQNGFLCDSEDAWANAFEAVRDPAVRIKFAYSGWGTVQDRYTIQPIGDQWLALLQPKAEKGRPRTPLVRSIGFDELFSYSVWCERNRAPWKAIEFWVRALARSPARFRPGRAYLLLGNLMNDLFKRGDSWRRHWSRREKTSVARFLLGPRAELCPRGGP